MEWRSCIPAVLSTAVTRYIRLSGHLYGTAHLQSTYTDMHLGNVLLRIPGIDQMSRADLQHYLGRPHKRPLTSVDGSPVLPSLHQPKYVLGSLDRKEPFERHLSTSPFAINPKIRDSGESIL